MKVTIQLPYYATKFLDDLDNYHNVRFPVIKGGRGGAKSTLVAQGLLLQSEKRKCTIICAREYQSSIADSVYSLLVEQIEFMKMTGKFSITKTEIKEIRTGSKFIFKGLQNIDSLKSIPYITHIWVEEARTISQRSLDIVIPTIREDGSQIIFTYNPENETDPISQMFCVPADELPPKSSVLHVNIWDNPFAPQTLHDQANYLKKKDYNKWLHIYKGEFLKNSEAQIFAGCFVVQRFDIEDEWFGPYNGLDFGFKDPFAAVQLYIDDKKKRLMIRRAHGASKVKTSDLKREILKVTLEPRDKIYADPSRPDTIDYLNDAKRGLNVSPAMRSKPRKKKEGDQTSQNKKEVKSLGSIMDGIEFMKSFELIVIHPDCRNTSKKKKDIKNCIIYEFENYSFVKDRLTDEITNKPEDKNNHFIDACRYALCKAIRKLGTSIFDNL